MLTNPRYPAPVAPVEVLEKLATAKATVHHEFWPDDVSLTDSSAVDARHLQGHQQITDVYLLALAVKHGGRLVTFDSDIPAAAVTGARAENLAMI